MPEWLSADPLHAEVMSLIDGEVRACERERSAAQIVGPLSAVARGGVRG